MAGQKQLMFGFQPEPIVGADGELGLRSERPEEYGLQQEGAAEEADAGTGNAAENESEPNDENTSTE